MQRGPKRLVLVLQDLLFGGTQRHAVELATRLDRGRFIPEFWLLSNGADFAPKLEHAGIEIRFLSKRRTVTLGALRALNRQLRRSRPDIVMPLTAVPNIWGRIFGRLAGTPLIIGTLRGGGNIKRQHERFLARLAHHHIANTRALKQSLLALGRPEGSVSVIPNGVDTDFFCPDPEGVGPLRKVVLCVARFCEDKDHLTLLNAFARVLSRIPDAELWLVGDGPLQGRVERAAARIADVEEDAGAGSGAGSGAGHGADAGADPGRVKFYPSRPDLRPFYRQASVLALSSLREGMPNVVLEGMASGLPVAATAVGGIPEVVEHGRTGLLSPARDAATLAENLIRLLSDETARQAMAAEARSVTTREYSMIAMVARHEELFTRLAGE